MCMIGTPAADDSESKMNTHSIVDFANCSLAKECKRLYDDEVKINGVKSCSKY